MFSNLAKNIEELTIELTNIKSVVGTKSELDMTAKVYEKLSQLPYFKNNPDYLYKLNFIDDDLNRDSIVSMVKGEKDENNKTLILIAHTDTVGISDYGAFKDYATDPLQLTDKLKEVTLAKEAKADLASGDYLFGRGIFDMKCGVATFISIIEAITKNIKEFSGNLIFAAVGDEEGNSGGMLSVVPELVELREKEGFEYQAVIDNDYMAPRFKGDENKYIYIGTVGKLLPAFYVVGKETHVGEPYNGIDPNQLAGAITNRINLNVDFCDIAEGEVSLPPVTLRQRDLKPEYSAQTGRTATLYFNYATHQKTPDQVLELLINSADEAFASVIEDLNKQYKIFCQKSNYPIKELPWKSRVISYQTLYNKVKEEIGVELDQKIEKLANELIEREELDDRDISLKIVEEVHKLWSDKEPVIIVYYAPPYYPHIFVEGQNKKEKNLLDSVNKAVDEVDCEYRLVSRKFYPYISDLSFVSAPKDDGVINTLKENMPALGKSYDLPLKEMQQLSLPVVNIGPFGKDAHQFTERLQKEYSFQVAPKLVYKTIFNLLEND